MPSPSVETLPPVTVRAVELRRVRLPLVEPFRTAHGTTTERDVLIVRVEADEAEGWAECAALPGPTYTAEYVDGAHRLVREHLLPRLAGRRGPAAPDVGPASADVVGHPMAKAVLEGAVLDAQLRAAGRSLAAHLGAVTDRVPSGVAVGVTSSIDELVAAVVARFDEGYRRVKLKVAPGWDVEPVRAVREAVGPDALLQVDANGSYTLDDVDRLAALDDYALALIEQPFPPGSLLDHAALAARIGTPVCLDESITSLAEAADALRLGACSVVNLKAGRVGGLLEARRIHDLCVERGAGLWCGGMLETGLGRAALVALAACRGARCRATSRPATAGTAANITRPFVLDDGHLRVPDGPGCGVTPDPAALAEATVSVETVRL